MYIYNPTNKKPHEYGATCLDISYVADLITGYNYLKSEAEAYKQFINTGDIKYIEEYGRYRMQAWNLISELFGFE